MKLLTIVSLLIALWTLSGCSRNPDTPLTIAAHSGNNAEVQKLLQQGAKVVNEKDSNGLTALMWAARSGHTEVMKSLVDAGADMNLRDCASNGWTALIHAVHKNQNKAVLLLIERGADVNARAGGCKEKLAEGGSTALMYAAGYDNTEVVKALLSKGASPYAESGGHTVLGNAIGGAWDVDRPKADKCPTETVKALFEKAPDLKLSKDFWDRSALWFARRSGCAEVVQMVERAEKSRQVASAQ
jgi:ankyrin repeat protein